MPPVAMFNVNLDNTLGAIELGVLLSCVLYGILCVQAYVYYKTFPEDSRGTKCLVAFLWIFETAQLLSVCYALYVITITDYGRPETILRLPNAFFATPLIIGLTAPIVQVFFASRIRIVSGKPYISIACWILSASHAVGSLFLAAEAFQMTSIPQFAQQWRWLVTLALSLSAADDALITTSLCYYLRKGRIGASHTTQPVIDRLIAWTIQTGLMSSFSSAAALICFLVMKENMVWVGILCFLSRLFAISLLASLNGRSTLRALSQKQSLSCYSEQGSRSPYKRPSTSGSHTPGSVRIQMSKVIEVDMPQVMLEVPPLPARLDRAVGIAV